MVRTALSCECSCRRFAAIALAGELINSAVPKLATQAAASARQAGAEVTLIDLKDYPLPFYDGDLESQVQMPEGGRRLKDLMQAHHGFLIASPEYNSSVSGVSLRRWIHASRHISNW